MDLLLIVGTIISILSASLLVYMGRNPNFLKLKEQPKVAEIEQDAPVGWECTEYSQRLLEEKLVAAGAMKAVEVTTCEDPKCVLCEGTRLLVSKEAHRESKEKLQSAKNYSAQALSTTVNVDGVDVERPSAVPLHAQPQLFRGFNSDFGRVVWNWYEGGMKQLEQVVVLNEFTAKYIVDPAPYMEDYGSRRECGEWLCG